MGYWSIAFDVKHAERYYAFVVKTFKCADTEALAKGRRVRRWANIASVARRKLRQLQIAGRIDDLRVPPGNRLEALRATALGSTVSARTTSFACASAGRPPARRT